MKKLLTLFTVLFVSVFVSFATDYAPMGDLPASPSQSSTLPFYTASGTYTSITQQLYYASEMVAAGAEAGDITALKFYFGNNSITVREVTRNLEIYIKLVPTTFTEFEVGFTNTDKYTYKFTNPGSSANKVFDGNYTIPATSVNGAKIERTINTSSFYWDGTSNILVTIIDKTNKKFYSISGDDYSDSNLKSYGKAPAVTASRFVHQYWTVGSSSEFTTYRNSLEGKFGYCSKNSTSESTERTAHSYVNIIKFTIEPAATPTAPDVPTGLSATPGTTAASLTWNEASGATSYNLYHSTSAEGLYTKFASPATNSYNWTGLTASTTYYVKVSAVNGIGESALSDPFSFTTQDLHIHDGITFEPWSNASALPTSGNYYLATDVALAPYDPTTITLTGNLNLCLNGHEANVYGSKIVVPDGKTLAIYDNVGDGKLTGFVASEVGTFDAYAKALIVVYNGAFLELYQGTIENTYIPDEDGQSYAIYSNGTLHLSGDVLINSNSADIYLYASNNIILDGAISNAEKHTVWKNGGTFTYGWSTYMSGKNPRDYFESANIARAVCLNEGEAALRTLLRLSESSNNSAIADHRDIVLDIALTRSLTSSQYNTFCLPINLTNAQLEAIFGVGYDLQEFDHSNFDGETLELTFIKRTELTEGEPYLIKPAFDVVNPYFEGVTIYSGEPGAEETDDNISFYSIFAPTELEGGNKNILFLGANNELFWPEATGNIKGFRAYFEVKGDARKAVRARIAQQSESTEAVINISADNKVQKVIRDGQLYLMFEGRMYNVQGQRIQ